MWAGVRTQVVKDEPRERAKPFPGHRPEHRLVLALCKEPPLGQARWHTRVNPATGRQKEKDLEFKANFGYLVNSRQHGHRKQDKRWKETSTFQLNKPVAL